MAAEYLGAAVARAREGSFDALVIELDTPGGLDLSMREIVKAELASTVPVIVYVSPAGARAASAGVFIAMAAHVAAMTPGTNIGAAHPVNLGGGHSSEDKKKEGDSVMETKVANDATAYLQAIASRRGRNVRWAEEVVLRSTSIPSGVAVRENVVDLEADSVGELLNTVDGRVLADFKGHPLRTKGAELVRFEMTARQKALATISDPNIAMILMSVGVSGILIELYSPGLILPGIVGAVALTVAFYSFQTLSAGWAGFLLILLAFVLFLVEFKLGMATHGLLAMSAVACGLFGGLMLYQGAGVAVSWIIVGSALGTVALFIGTMGYFISKAFRRESPFGVKAMRGIPAKALTAIDYMSGEVFWRGERWQARSLEGRIDAESDVSVDYVDGLVLKVRPKR